MISDLAIHYFVSTSQTLDVLWFDCLKANISSDFRKGLNKAAQQLNQQGFTSCRATNSNL